VLEWAGVNFFGHAVIAHAHRRSPAFGLGAMLPDLASMCQGRLGEPDSAELAEGIAFHHASDGRFHRLPGFARLCRDAEARFRRAGCARGGARGAAHAGVELLLDGAWVADDHHGRAYLDAVRAGRDDRLGGCIAWAAPDGAGRFAALRDRLESRGLPWGYRDPAVVGDILVHILSRRRLLALSPDDALAVRSQLPAVQEQVFGEAAALRAALI